MSILGVKIQDSFFASDNRGTFMKYFTSGVHNLIDFRVSEIFVTTSGPGVVRGMHLQTKKSASNRLISCLSGKILDVQLDLRPDSPTYMEINTVSLGGGEPSCIYIPAGVAHGFQALEESTVHYISDQPHNPGLDSGVRIDELNIDWQSPITFRSQRDMELPSLAEWIGKNPL